MKLKRIDKTSATELTLLDGTVVLFSYQTPVAACLAAPVEHAGKATCFVRTDKKWSATTSKHINRWLDGARAKEMPQSFLDSLVSNG